MLPFPPPPTDLLALSEGAMVEFVRERGWPTYRAAQILRWLYQGRVRSFAEMTNLAQKDREHLAASCIIGRTRTVQTFASQDGTTKFVLTLADHTNIECVLIPDDERLTLCLSSQVGCTLDCGFCLTGTLGLTRNLRPHEIVDQVLLAQDHLTAEQRITNLVFMGMGEPLANLDAVSEAIERLTDSTWGLGFSPRRITISTAGLASRLRDVAALKVNLAISLNAPTDDLRREVMPAANRLHPLDALLTACRNYPLAERDRLTFEYVLLAEVNDRPEDAARLINLLRGLRAKVNLIPFNPFPGSPYRRPTEQAIARFQQTLRDAHVDAYLRRSRGRDVLGACGQLGRLGSFEPTVALTQIESRC
ncbi:23S rRNA (adenine(2503)-C(2))-methyltransferase RlmN [Nitrospirales bacterium NOB]|nr:MAG: ribosomal RNA large subunit methyltransferase N [Nitrospira sp. OLB3]MBV6471412.1 Dual-specificity RNA methyltransferase RlmN [Nitrospirota bacterium]MCE7965584.1 23S rRNA (adenine(2503)-C(2))-methyltransferase RlmN [Nitrospira sp. NTP2]MDL1889815.1 23S rRNA (adenine(2503)-C(2))-methyltransferase RlmN [Nitrospirales bacterium NOB]QOJ36014.1 MAG: 23S rRNA (adenine(2503)-C(2))-methyltransferase RlmN [Nitrospira sp.]